MSNFLRPKDSAPLRELPDREVETYSRVYRHRPIVLAIHRDIDERDIRALAADIAKLLELASPSIHIAIVDDAGQCECPSDDEDLAVQEDWQQARYVLAAFRMLDALRRQGVAAEIQGAPPAAVDGFGYRVCSLEVGEVADRRDLVRVWVPIARARGDAEPRAVSAWDMALCLADATDSAKLVSYSPDAHPLASESGREYSVLDAADAESMLTALESGYGPAPRQSATAASAVTNAFQAQTLRTALRFLQAGRHRRAHIVSTRYPHALTVELLTRDGAGTLIRQASQRAGGYLSENREVASSLHAAGKERWRRQVGEGAALTAAATA